MIFDFKHIYTDIFDFRFFECKEDMFATFKLNQTTDKMSEL